MQIVYKYTTSTDYICLIRLKCKKQINLEKEIKIETNKSKKTSQK